MDALFVRSFVEDRPSKEALLKLVERHNRTGCRPVAFFPGFPEVKNGFGNIKAKCSAFLNLAAGDQYTLILTDLDTAECPATLVRDWFFSGKSVAPTLPKQVIFRVAVREVEAWLMADREGLAKFLGISPANFGNEPEALPDPKRFLLDVIHRKARKQWIRDMLPAGRAGIGPGYNENLCAFIKNHWSIDRACLQAPSLQRAVNALARV